ncbi:MAG: SHOCT domain-containing protein [Candidatus Caccovivens sp.]
MMYMNKTKRGLILVSAIVNLITITLSLILSILLIVNAEAMQEYLAYYYFVSLSPDIVYAIISFVIGLVGSILLIYSVRQKGKYFRTSQGVFVAGFIIIILFGGFLSWLLLFVSLFVPDIIVMNNAREVKKEEKMEEREYEDKKKQIEDLKRMRDNGLISEEEYKQKLFEIL